nr:hypothetical protein [Cyanobacteria bacterium RUI128]
KGGLGNDIITSGKNNDTIIGGKGTNVFVYNEGSGNDTVKLTKGEKLVIKYITNAEEPQFEVKENGKNVIITGTYTNENGEKQTDTITVANMTKNNLAESVVFEYGSDKDNTTHAYDLVNDVYVINGTKTKIKGTNLNETIYGTTLSDTIKGCGGNDTIIGDVGNDTLYGGAGVDTFVFGTYEFNGRFYGSGKDTICDIQEGEILEFKNSNIEDITFTQSKKNLIITYQDKDSNNNTVENVVTLKNYYKKSPNIIIRAYDAQGNLAEYSSIELFTGVIDTDAIAAERKELSELANTQNNNFIGNLLDHISTLSDTNHLLGVQNGNLAAQINNTVNYVQGTSGNDIFNGTDKKELFDVLSGDNIIQSADGEDKVRISDNFENMLFGKSADGKDLIVYYNNNHDSVRIKDWFVDTDNRLDTIIDSTGVEHKISTEADYENHIFFTGDNDTLDLLPDGNFIDALAGGDDVFIYSPNNTVYFGDGGNDIVYLMNGSHNTTVLFREENDRCYKIYSGKRADITNESPNDSVIYFENFKIEDLKFDATRDFLEIIAGKGSVYVDQWLRYDNTINKIQDCTGTIYNLDEIVSQYGVNTPTSHDDCIRVINNQTVNSLDGNDEILVIGKNNTVSGGKGNDEIILCEESSNTIIEFERGDGNDYINPENNHKSDSVIYFKDTKFEDLSFTKNYGDLKISNGKGSISISFWFEDTKGIDSIMDCTGTIYNLSDLAKIQALNTPTNEVDYIKLTGYQKVDARSGNDVIYVHGENNTITGGKGNDSIYLYPDSSKTIIEYTQGNGRDHIRCGGDYLGDGGDSAIYFSDTKFSNLSFSREYSTLVINTPNGSVDIEGWFTRNNTINTIIDMYGNTYNLSKTIKSPCSTQDKCITSVYSISDIAAVQALAQPTSGPDRIKITDNQIINSLNGDDYIYAYGGNNTISGGDGTDNIYIYGRNNIVSGGKGNDYISLVKGSANTTIEYTQGSGNDVIYMNDDNYSAETTSVLYFKDTHIDDLKYESYCSTLKIHTPDGYVRLEGWFYSGHTVNAIKDCTGNLYTISELEEVKALNTPTDDSDCIIVKDENTVDNLTVIGGKGDDNYSLWGENHTLIFSSGDGNDIVNAKSIDNSTHTLKFADKTVNNITFSADGNDLKINYSDNDSVTLTDWFSHNNVINKVVDSSNVTTSLDQLHSDVTAWMSAHTEYADVESALADTQNADVAQLIAYFNIN